MAHAANDKTASGVATLASPGTSQHKSGLWALALGSVGVVYGDIGTSPLYAFRVAVVAAVETGPVTRDIVLGVLSLILWALIVVVAIKYVLLLLRADNNGEGGTLSLTALATRAIGRRTALVFLLGVIGASMFLGDAVITPAISVLSAVEGLKLVTPAFDHYVVPLTIAILFGLFAGQSRGTARVASLFAPIMVVWFVAIAAAGLLHIRDDPGVLAAINPAYAVMFLHGHGDIGLVTLGLVFLVVTGGEALYADLGHFGRVPIQAAWFGLVLPALVLNYFGQGAKVLAEPSRDREPVLPAGARDAAAAHGRAGDGGDGDRQPGRDHRRLFAGASGHSARPSAAARHPAHLGVAGRTNLHSPRHRGAAGRRPAAGRPVPHLERARVGLWHRGRHHHGRRRRARVHRDLEAVALAAVAGGRHRCSAGVRGYRRSSRPTCSSCSRAPGRRSCSAPRWCC